MKILLIGKTGQLGASLLNLDSEHQWYAPNRAELDLESIDSCRQAMRQFQPDIVINTAAFHNLPMCESHPGRAFAVNCKSVRDLALLCKEHDTLFITFSSDYVFDGATDVPYNEYSPTSPLQMYGITRLAGEHAVMSVAPQHSIVIRTCGLYGTIGAASKGGNFVDNRIKDAQHLPHIEMGCDQIVSPTSALDLAKAVLTLIQHPKRKMGIYHLVNQGECSWYEFTCKIIELMKLDVKVVPIDRNGLSGDMRRPKYSVLANIKAKKLGINMQHWQDALSEYITAKYLN
ncbi:dTDP-4-dehydrorhamnose reductase [Paraglaciecola arctica]|uniref:dTDP-4-dehydrorhamnose reductase n=1 Tax=Paraglaciecola arctica TaxID=1128911 RepID=UPI001C06FBDC|nr:dTDP-4-dehydrorhamnose reductase [Paraglaciecola arctica]MBU3002086.1 dTDP-4-dehydrorhamnose reductase [Paraglaciecola arctica]